MMRICTKLLLLGVSLFLIMGCDSGWEDTISRQANQPGSNSRIDSIVISIMKRYEIPGISFAIAKNDTLLYIKGYGYADIPSKTEVTTSSLFRIGYLLLPITAMAVLQLIQQRKISMDEKVFGDSGILGNDFCKQLYDPAMKDITVDELLHQTVDWPNDEYSMALNQSLNSSQYLTWILKTFPLQSIPGKSFHYSYMNYLVLEKIIEKISSDTYPGFVKSSILRPIGISDMEIAGNNPEDRRKNEVTHYVWTLWNSYYDQEPYQINISRMRAAAGWLASPMDLLKFLVRADRFNPIPDILDTSTMKIMIASSQANAHFACGWWLNDNFHNWFATGNLIGSVTEMARTDNGYCWVILTNKSPRGPGYEDALDQLAWKIISDTTIKWPKRDLLEKL
ncbi:MAG TPA: serine hydrolase domain-containing protein [Puia sp.]|nr:serine hydrolase domain-containing protein [Puia sp.]